MSDDKKYSDVVVAAYLYICLCDDVQPSISGLHKLNQEMMEFHERNQNVQPDTE